MSSVLAALVLVALAGSAMGKRPTAADINDQMDKVLEAHNQMLRKLHKETVDIPEGTTDGVVFGKGKQYHLDTMRRSGPGVAVPSPDGKSTLYKYPITYDQLAFSFDSVTFPDGRKLVEPKIRVAGGNKFIFDFAVNQQPQCSVTLEEYKFQKLESLQAEGGNVSSADLDKLAVIMMDHVNSLLEKKKVQVEQHLQGMCNPPKES